MVKRIARSGLIWLARRLGWEHKLALAFMETESALMRLARRGVKVSSVIDVGASNGCWSEVASRVWPSLAVHLVEANAVHEPSLVAVTQKYEGWSYVLAAASSRKGVVKFDATDPLGGVASDSLVEGEGVCTVPAVTIDDEVTRLGLRSPYLVKLDTHGVEMDVLEGARTTLTNASVLVIEAYNFRIGDKAPRFWELCEYLEREGFLPIDLTEPLWRPYDGALWQFDLVFLRHTSPEFKHNSYE